MYERRKESWRSPWNRQRGDEETFIRLFLLCFVEPEEDGLPLHAVTYQKLKGALANRIIPWIELPHSTDQGGTILAH